MEEETGDSWDWVNNLLSHEENIPRAPARPPAPGPASWYSNCWRKNVLGSDWSWAAAENIAMHCLQTATALHDGVVTPIYYVLGAECLWCGVRVWGVRCVAGAGAGGRSQETQYRDLHGERIWAVQPRSGASQPRLWWGGQMLLELASAN